MKQRNVVRTVYLYLVTVVGIVMALTGLIGAITSVLNMYVFRLITSDSMQNELASLLTFASSVAVGVPVWLYHWSIIQETRQHALTFPTTAPAAATASIAATVIPQPEVRHDLIRRLYIYLLSAIGLFIVMFNLINIAPDVYRAFFMSLIPMATPQQPNVTGPVSLNNTYAIQNLIRNIVAVLVGTPVWLYHWHLGQNEHRDPPSD